jgi:hypothetical protein
MTRDSIARAAFNRQIEAAIAALPELACTNPTGHDWQEQPKLASVKVFADYCCLHCGRILKRETGESLPPTIQDPPIDPRDLDRFMNPDLEA